MALLHSQILSLGNKKAVFKKTLWMEREEEELIYIKNQVYKVLIKDMKTWIFLNQQNHNPKNMHFKYFIIYIMGYEFSQLHW